VRNATIEPNAKVRAGFALRAVADRPPKIITSTTTPSRLGAGLAPAATAVAVSHCATAGSAIRACNALDGNARSTVGRQGSLRDFRCTYRCHLYYAVWRLALLNKVLVTCAIRSLAIFR